MTIPEVSWLLEGLENSKKDYYEMISYSVKNAMVSVNKGKDMKMFDDATKEDNTISVEERETEMAYLRGKFKEL